MESWCLGSVRRFFFEGLEGRRVGVKVGLICGFRVGFFEAVVGIV